MYEVSIRDDIYLVGVTYFTPGYRGSFWEAPEPAEMAFDLYNQNGSPANIDLTDEEIKMVERQVQELIEEDCV